jgi:fibronectin type 3 domain-containing protein
VPLVPPPPPPGQPAITYDETAITVTWPAADAPSSKGTDEVLPSRIIGVSRPAIAYIVYDVTDPAAPVKLTASPIANAKYTDARVEWGAKRCYMVRATELVVAATIESEGSPSRCETPKDTFPPQAPKGLAAIASEGAINLIWEPNTEKDLDGYIVLRAIAPSDTLQPITPAPIKATTLRDGVQAGLQYIYAVRAVDKAGNQSPPSARVTETAR